MMKNYLVKYRSIINLFKEYDMAKKCVIIVPIS